MKHIVRIATVTALLSAQGLVSAPSATAASGSIAAPRDVAYAGEIKLAVDASDVERRIVHRLSRRLSLPSPDAKSIRSRPSG
jgi:hypothetical protein